MSSLEDEDDLLSTKSDIPKQDLQPDNFSDEPGPSDTSDRELRIRDQSTSSSCESTKSDHSKHWPVNFRSEPEPGPSHQRTQESRGRVHSGAASCESMRSDRSKNLLINYKRESETLSQDETDSHLCEEDQPSICDRFGKLLKDPVSTKERKTSDRDQSIPSGHHPGLNRRQTLESDDVLKEILSSHRNSLKEKFQTVNEGTDQQERETLLSKIYTDLYITEGLGEKAQTQHEVRHLETMTNRSHDAPTKTRDIFKPLEDLHQPIRKVLTCGVAGVGKTFLVQKFTLDWADGSENQDIDAVIPLSFRELNLIREQRHNLLSLIQLFHPSFMNITAEQLAVCKLLFILDGLDESRLSKDFNNRHTITNVTKKSSVKELLTNLIQGHLMPSALVWITSRPAAANQIPQKCVDRFTEIQGFNDPHKEEYFRKRFADAKLSSGVFSHVKNSKSLYTMCRIPLFCWITAVVLEDLLRTEQNGELPTTLTDMYSHFLMIQTKRKKCKYQQEHETSSQELTEADRDVILKLGKLAHQHLEEGNILFYQEDLQRCGLDEADVLRSGVCTEIFRKECGLFEKSVFSFVHLSIQEFLAAIYIYHSHCSKNVEIIHDLIAEKGTTTTKTGLPKDISPDELLVKVMRKSTNDSTGRLDLFVRFLHGLYVESNQKILRNLIEKTENTEETIQKAVRNLKQIKCVEFPERAINIFHCLMEMKDTSVSQEVQRLLQSKRKLSGIHCSALAYILQMSEVLKVFDLKEYNTTAEGRLRLIPAVTNCRKVRPAKCGVSDTFWAALMSALKSDSSFVEELDLSYNNLEYSSIRHLCGFLKSPSCKIKALRMKKCNLSRSSFIAMASAIKSNPSHLTELDLSHNKSLRNLTEDLSDFLKSPNFRLKNLQLKNCNLSGTGCATLASALESNQSHLLELHLGSNKDLQDSGVKHLCGFLESSECKLETLRLWDCGLSDTSCADIVSALRKNPSRLKELDLARNPELKDSGVQHLCGFLESPECKIRALRLEFCSLSQKSCAALESAVKRDRTSLAELDLRGHSLRDSDVQTLSEMVKTLGYKPEHKFSRSEL